MDFSITKQHQLLRKSFMEYLKKRCDSDSRREWLSSENGFSQTVWHEISELGWAGLPFDERYGGLGGSFLELFYLFEQLGAFQLYTPLFTSSILTGMVINEAASESQKQFHLSRLSEGEAVYSAAYPLQDNDTRAAQRVKAVPLDDAWLLTGTCLFVRYAAVAEKILVLADSVGGPTLFLVDPKDVGATVEPIETLDEEKEYAVRLEEAPAEKENIIGDIGKGRRYIDHVLPMAMVLKCAEMTGGLQAVMDMTVAYARQRHQFDRPLGALQIIQHYCADMFTDLEGARLLACQAAQRIDGGLEYRQESAMAKAWCSDVYTKSCLLAHQIFGANGFTEAYDLHLYTKHAKVSELMFGHSAFHRSAVADAMGV